MMETSRSVKESKAEFAYFVFSVVSKNLHQYVGDKKKAQKRAWFDVRVKASKYIIPLSNARQYELRDINTNGEVQIHKFAFRV